LIRARECGHCAFDLLELDGRDLRRQPIEKQKALLAKLLRGSLLSLVLNESLGLVAASDQSQEPENASGRAGAMQSNCARIYKDSDALETRLTW
jgi:ATP-dependent DNA ligase